MKGIKLGEMNTMKVVKEVDFGMYLDGGDEGEILLPTRYVPEGCKPGDTLDVFVYLDQDERPVATTLTPKANKTPAMRELTSCITCSSDCFSF